MSSCCRRVFLSPVFPHPKGPSAFTHKPLIRRQNPAGKALAHPTHLRTSHTTSSSIMASAQSFSNTSTGSKPADPYKSANKDEDVAVVDKVEDLSKFIDNCKYGMMTTHESASGNLVSRCMALAAKVPTSCPMPGLKRARISPSLTRPPAGNRRHRPPLPH